MNIIHIEKLLIITKIGIYNWEKVNLQKLIIDLKISYNGSLVQYNEYSKYFIDYKIISDEIILITNNRHFSLLEQLAEYIIQHLIKKFNVFWIKIKISKPNAIPNASNVSVTLKRYSKNN
ncbi:MAG: dihydroneopterin aldolase [Candidatus Lightella neohaematopini]|nr:dihydroneopterin aldolase [Candidatus Lightella neohaematopini]MCV2529041.1 dihydroneopterin aldolase [Candidatus Lightella neohaematopini]